MVAELAQEAHIPEPRIGISQINVPNAFAYGRSQKDGRICVTQGILKLLNKNELRAVLGHEMSHIKHRDMAVITLLSAIPMILYWIAMTTMYGGFPGTNNQRKGNGNYGLLIGIGALLFYFITNLLVLYGSRIREYYADKGSVELGNQPNQLATALYKLTNSSMNLKDKQELRKVEGAKAFFVTNPTRAVTELNELSQIDINKDGVIDRHELMTLRQMNIKLSTEAKIAEIFTTHPNMLMRIKQLANYAD